MKKLLIGVLAVLLLTSCTEKTAFFGVEVVLHFSFAASAEQESGDGDGKQFFHYIPSHFNSMIVISPLTVSIRRIGR